MWGRRLRAAVGMGLIWAGAWFGVGLVMLAIVGLEAADVPFPLGFGLLGFLAGAAFSGLLALGQRHRRFDQMSIARFGGLGGIGGVVLAAGVSAAGGVQVLGLAVVFAMAAGGSAAGSLLLARKAERAQERVGSGTVRSLTGPEGE